MGSHPPPPLSTPLTPRGSGGSQRVGDSKLIFGIKWLYLPEPLWTIHPSCTHIRILLGECNNIQWFQRTDLTCIIMKCNGTSIKYQLYLTWKRSAKNRIEDFIEKTAIKISKARKHATTYHLRQVADVFQGFCLSSVFKINCIYSTHLILKLLISSFDPEWIIQYIFGN